MIGIEGTEGRNPFEQLMLVWSVLTVLTVFATPTPGSITEYLPSWVVTACYILLCIGGLVGLVGVWLGNQILSLLVERAGMLITGSSATFYAVAIFTQVSHTPRAIPAGTIVLFFALASFWRGYRVQYYLRRLRAKLAEVNQE